MFCCFLSFFFFKQKTSYEMRISDWSSDVCSSDLSISVLQLVPMWRFTERIVRSGLVIAWRLATSPMSTSPPLEKATTEGVVRDPSLLGMTTGSPASRTETPEFVVPRSMPPALGLGGPQGAIVTPMSQWRIEAQCGVANF